MEREEFLTYERDGELKRFKTKKFIGQGTYGLVYRVEDIVTGSCYALKVVGVSSTPNELISPNIPEFHQISSKNLHKSHLCAWYDPNFLLRQESVIKRFNKILSEITLRNVGELQKFKLENAKDIFNLLKSKKKSFVTEKRCRKEMVCLRKIDEVASVFSVRLVDYWCERVDEKGNAVVFLLFEECPKDFFAVQSDPQYKKLDEHQLARYAYHIARGYEEINRLGVFHSDFGSKNILMKKDAYGEEIVVVCDFGRVISPGSNEFEDETDQTIGLSYFKYFPLLFWDTCIYQDIVTIFGETIKNWKENDETPFSVIRKKIVERFPSSPVSRDIKPMFDELNVRIEKQNVIIDELKKTTDELKKTIDKLKLIVVCFFLLVVLVVIVVVIFIVWDTTWLLSLKEHLNRRTGNEL